jgi:hypothetical protein
MQQPVSDLLKSLYSMALMVEARDAYTGGHLWRVSQFSLVTARALGVDEAECQRIALAGFLHDLGKVGVPDAILNKPDRLTDEEYEVIKTHPEIGARLLEDHPLAALAMGGVLYHHETPDGKGYPNGLSGEAIPLDARIIGVADAFDAMTSSRPYRKGMPIEKALSIVRENLGRQFFQDVGELFVQLGEQGKFDHIVGHSEAGIPLQPCVACGGPDMAVPRAFHEGANTYCPACGSEYRIHRGNGKLSLTLTGKIDKARAHVPFIDHELVATLVNEAAAWLEGKDSWWERWFRRRPGLA